MSGSATINGVNRNLGDGWASIGGVWRKIGGGWVTKGGVWQQIYSTGLPLASLPVGTIIKINESGVGEDFYLSCHDYESGLNGAGRSLLVRKMNWQTQGKFAESKNAYADSTMDTWHNSTYKPMLSAKVQELIGTTTFYYTEAGKSSGVTIPVTTLSRSVFQLSLWELGKTYTRVNKEGSTLPIASTLQVGKKYSNNGTTVSTATQWTRSPVTSGTTSIGYLAASGGALTQACTEKGYYRPAFTLPANAVVNPEPNADGSYTLIE